MAKDIIGREIKVDDFVAFYSNVYQVLSVPDNGKNNCMVTIILAHKSKTTKKQHKLSTEMCLIPKEDALIWMLTRK